ncbi:MAG: hypothetical protein H6Q75_1555 [Firmicutes bacterium]|nr:hypothetical protein [Bacillota bacterium]
MMTVQNLVLVQDIVRLPKTTLEEICTKLSVTKDGSLDELTVRIWGQLVDNPELQNSALEHCRNRIFGGRLSVTWYTPADGFTLSNLFEILTENCNFDVFNTIKIPQNITTTPEVIGAAKGEQEGEYFLRFIYKSPIFRNFYDIKTVYPRSAVATVVINESNGYIEVRADYKSAPQIAAALGQLIKIPLKQKRIGEKSGNRIEGIAKALNGNLVDASAKPDLLLDEPTVEQAKAVIKILAAIDCFFENEDTEILRTRLLEGREAFGVEIVHLPFAARVLSGLGKVGLGVSSENRDLRATPLYGVLEPYLQNQGGYIRFSIGEDASVTHTVRVGMTTNSIFFATPASEFVIDYIRERVIM